MPPPGPEPREELPQEEEAEPEKLRIYIVPHTQRPRVPQVLSDLNYYNKSKLLCAPAPLHFQGLKSLNFDVIMFLSSFM